MQNQGETAFSIIATLSAGPQKTNVVLGPPKRGVLGMADAKTQCLRSAKTQCLRSAKTW